jgi:hypothetical protein
MKVWGYRAFENEAAVKWVAMFFLGRSPVAPGNRQPIEDAFEVFGEWGRGSPQEYPSAEVVAACEYLAALVGRPGGHVPSAVLDAAAGVKGKVSAALLARGVKYLERIAAKSELVERWRPTPHHAPWLAYLGELAQRLK